MLRVQRGKKSKFLFFILAITLNCENAVHKCTHTEEISRRRNQPYLAVTRELIYMDVIMRDRQNRESKSYYASGGCYNAI